MVAQYWANETFLLKIDIVTFYSDLKNGWSDKYGCDTALCAEK
jgi:hypothetical protein